jgi:hypothetical protein
MVPSSATTPPTTPPAIARVFVSEAGWLAELFVEEGLGIDLVADRGAAR